MKTTFQKSSLVAIAIFLVVLSGLAGCKKDDETKPAPQEASLAGQWTVKSFTIDNVEALGLVIAGSDFEFDRRDSASGRFTWNITYADNSQDIVTGDFTLSDGDKKITLQSGDGEQLILNLDIDGNHLTISGSMDEGEVVVKADRK